MSDLERQISGDYDDLRDQLAFLPSGKDKELSLHWLRKSQQFAVEAIRRDGAAMAAAIERSAEEE